MDRSVHKEPMRVGRGGSGMCARRETSKLITSGRRERGRKGQVDTVANVKMRQDLKARRGRGIR